MVPVLVIIPTYNERENIESICHAVLHALPEAHILIVDDNSPDGTGQLARSLSSAYASVHVLHRPAKQGLGRAYLDGFRWALERDYGFIVEMDADFSHDPRYLYPMAAAAKRADVVIGSRYVVGGGTVGWGLTRQLISRGGGLYARLVLNLPIRDLTSGFVGYRRRVLDTLDLNSIRLSGFGFQIEMKYRAVEAGFTFEEIPIVFRDRTVGSSKMSTRIALEAFVSLWRVRYHGRKTHESPAPPQQRSPDSGGRERE